MIGIHMTVFADAKGEGSRVCVLFQWIIPSLVLQLLDGNLILIAQKCSVNDCIHLSHNIDMHALETSLN